MHRRQVAGVECGLMWLLWELATLPWLPIVAYFDCLRWDAYVREEWRHVFPGDTIG